MQGMFSNRLKFCFFIFLITAVCVMVRTSPAYSYSLGGYFTTQVGGYNWNITKSSNYFYPTQNPPSYNIPVMIGGGLIWTGEFLDGQFMFRQNLGFEAMISSQFEMTRFSFVNTFAFVPYRTELFLVWFGLQANLFYIWGSDSEKSFSIYNDLQTGNIPVYKKRKYEFLPIGTGLALGLDYDVYQFLRLSFEGGIHISTSVYGQSHDVADISASVFGYEGYVTVSVMYRFDQKVRPLPTHQDEESETSPVTD
jgi:hypothetical protein